MKIFKIQTSIFSEEQIILFFSKHSDQYIHRKYHLGKIFVFQIKIGISYVFEGPKIDFKGPNMNKSVVYSTSSVK